MQQSPARYLYCDTHLLAHPLHVDGFLFTFCHFVFTYVYNLGVSVPNCKLNWLSSVPVQSHNEVEGGGPEIRKIHVVHICLILKTKFLKCRKLNIVYS